MSVVVGSVMNHGFPFALTTESQILPSVSRRSGAWIGHLSRILTVSYLCTCACVSHSISYSTAVLCNTSTAFILLFEEERK